MKNKTNLLLAFLIPFFILFVIFYKEGFLTDSTLLTSDLSVQYYHFLVLLKDFFSGIGNLFYTFKLGIGQSFFDIFLYYLFTPVNLILKFISYDVIHLFIAYIVLFKISLCGLTMYKYLTYHFKTNSYLLIFSTAYALSTTILANYFNIMWLDAYILAPIVLLGIDKIIKEDKPLLYGITLFICILTNYYMGYIVCFYCVLYFIYKLFMDKFNKKTIITFITTSLLAGLMTMFTHFTGLLNILKTNTGLDWNFGLNASPMMTISSLLIGNDEAEFTLNLTYPRLYIGILMLILLYFYFTNSKINKKEKKLSFIFMGIFLVFILFNPFNTIWHAFSDPTGFNFRYVFLINIFVLTLCCQSLIKIKYVFKFHYLCFLYLFVICCFIGIFNPTTNNFFVYLSLTFALIYLAIIYYSKSKFILMSLFFLELFINTYFVFQSIPTAESIDLLFDQNISNTISTINNNQFYRTDFTKSDNYKYNSNILYDVYGVSLFSSTISQDISDFFEKIGYSVKTNSYNFENYYIINSILGIKYYADTSSADKVIEQYDNYNIYENEQALNLGYIVSEKSKTTWDCGTPFECQELLFNKMTDSNADIYVDYSFVKKSEVEYKLIMPDDYLYIYISIDYENINDTDLEIYINDELSGAFHKKDQPIITSSVLKNEYSKDQPLNIKIVSENTDLEVDFKAYTFDYDKYLSGIDKLKDNQLEIIEFDNSYIKGTIDKEGVLFTSIPYSENWNVYIDGEKAETYKLFDMFLGVDIEKGQHIIEFRYELKSLKVGFIISIVSMVTFIIFIHKKSSVKDMR